MTEELNPQAREFSLRDYLDILRRRKGIAIQTFVLVCLVGVLATFMTKPTYRTSARILVEGRELTLAQYNTSDPLANLFMPDVGHDIATQLEVLGGEEVMRDAFSTANVSPLDVKLDIKQVGQTDVIEIAAESNTPDYAVRITRTLPDIYRKYMTGDRKDEIVRALTSSRQRLEEQKKKLNDIELKQEAFKKRTNVPNVEIDRTQKMAEAANARSDRNRAQTEVAAAQARYAAVTADRARQKKFIETPTSVTNNTVRQPIIEEINRLEGEREKALFYYKPESFQIKQLDSQIAHLKVHLKETPEELKTVTRTLNPELAAYDQKVNEARANLESAQAQLDKTQAHFQVANAALGRFGSMDHEAEQLQTEHDMAKTEVETLSKAVENLDLRDKANHDPIKLVTPAGPAEQVAPKKMNNLIYSVVVGLILALGLALLQEFLDDRINSAEELRRLLPTPLLGYVPMIEKEEGRLLSHSQSAGSTLESYRVLRSNVQFATVGAKVSSLLVTSTAPGEGKSTTATNLAVAMALDGRRVILVDTDLRRPTVHQKFGMNRGVGLTNVLIGHASLSSALRDTDIPGLQVLTSGPLPPNPAELLNSQPMHDLHARLKEHADVVIYDSPPCLATADAQVLSAAVDGVLYVVQFGETKKSAVRHAVEMLQQAHANLLGIVFNKIELTGAEGKYYYGYYNYYHASESSEQPQRRALSEFEALLKNGNGAENGHAKAAVGGDADEEVA